MKKKNFMFYLLLVGLVAGCSNEELKNEIERLKENNSILEAKLDDCEHGAEKLLAALTLSFEAENFNDVTAKYKEIKNRHPESSQFNEAEAIFAKTETILKRRKEEEVKRKKEEEAVRLKALNKLKKKHDDISGITWYRNPYFTHYDNSNGISIYIGEENKRTWLILKMSYSGSDWIFFERAYLSYEGNTLEIPFDKYKEKKTDNSGRGVWEWISVPVTEGIELFLYKLANSTDAKMRLAGKYSHTRNLSVNEKKGILDVIAGRDVLRKQ